MVGRLWKGQLTNATRVDRLANKLAELQKVDFEAALEAHSAELEAVATEPRRRRHG